MFFKKNFFLFKKRLLLGLIISTLLHGIVLHSINSISKHHKRQEKSENRFLITIAIRNPEINANKNSIDVKKIASRNLERKNNTATISTISKNPYIVGEWQLDTSSWPPGTRKIISVRIFISALGKIEKWELLSEPDPLVISALNSISETLFNPKYENGLAVASEVNYVIEVISE